MPPSTRTSTGTHSLSSFEWLNDDILIRIFKEVYDDCFKSYDKASESSQRAVATLSKVVCESKVRDDDVAVAIQEKVLELQVAMDDLLLMQVVDSGDELCEQSVSVRVRVISNGVSLNCGSELPTCMHPSP